MERTMTAATTIGHLVAVDDASHVATITLDRPQAYNAVTADMLESLLATLGVLERDARVRAIVVTGNGKGFCTGQALDDPRAIGEEPGALHRAVVERFNPLVAKMFALEKPTIAAINGVAAGAGWGIALACDFRVAAESATFTTAFAKIGLVPDSGVSYLLPQIVGYAKALELCVLAERIDSATAKDLGLLTRVVNDTDLLREAAAFAATLAAGPRSLGLIKRELVRNALPELARALAYEAEMQGVAGETDDFREGVAAFKAKRRAVFTGT
jgi:2-(1,2-epoxy-1,2-dihydrophenyl)acetyl-CoA isomerase